MFIFLYCVCVFTSICIFFFPNHFKNPRKHSNPPPCPAALPILGHLHLLTAAPQRALQSLSKKHGAVMQLYCGRRGLPRPKRRRLCQPPRFPRNPDSRIQQHHHRIRSLRRPLEEPPPRHRRPLILPRQPPADSRARRRSPIHARENFAGVGS
ncbi:cytochrome P450 81Q32-like [Salvia divinorum]|uniref:Cytochrome P450 81Q32-like n=1 Tax=Salvia divinorum TaxID=28513 RepID=A0ABD1GRZ6_SALDI